MLSQTSHVRTPSDAEGVGHRRVEHEIIKDGVDQVFLSLGPSSTWYGRADDSGEKDRSQREKIRSHCWSRNDALPGRQGNRTWGGRTLNEKI
jgi:hypothetical protein